MNPLTGGCLPPAAVTGPLASAAAAVIRRFVPIMNRMGETVHPVTIPISRSCHVAVNLAVLNHSLNDLR